MVASRGRDLGTAKKGVADAAACSGLYRLNPASPEVTSIAVLPLIETPLWPPTKDNLPGKEDADTLCSHLIFIFSAFRVDLDDLYFRSEVISSDM